MALLPAVTALQSTPFPDAASSLPPSRLAALCCCYGPPRFPKPAPDRADYEYEWPPWAWPIELVVGAHYGAALLEHRMTQLFTLRSAAAPSVAVTGSLRRRRGTRHNCIAGRLAQRPRSPVFPADHRSRKPFPFRESERQQSGAIASDVRWWPFPQSVTDERRTEGHCGCEGVLLALPK